MLKVLEVIRKLRSPTGCPWNRSRTSKDLLQAAHEELLELEAALEHGITWQVRDELGDVLFNILALCELHQEKGLFTLDEIDTAIAQKMIRRHPYVFGNEPDPGSEAAVEQWRRIKQQ